MLVLHKLLPLIVSPLGLVILLLVLSVILRRRTPTILALGVLLIGSLPLTADRIWTVLESDYPYQPIKSVENADAVVVLSGMLGGVETVDGVVSQWGGAIDRFFVGIDLLSAGKAPLIIFSRPSGPGSIFHQRRNPRQTRTHDGGEPKPDPPHRYRVHHR